MNGHNANKVILSLDNHCNILNFKFSNGFAIWPQVRYTIYKELINIQDKAKEKRPESFKIRRFSLFRATKYYIKVFSRNPLKNNVKYDCLIFNSSISCFKNIDGISMSKINHFFIDIKSLKILNIFQSIRGKYYSKYTEPYVYHEALYLKSALQAKLNNKTPDNDYKTIVDFIRFLKKEICENIDDQFYNELKNALFSFAKVHYYLVENFNKLFTKTTPKFIVVEDGNYGGGDKATLLWCANKLKIKSIEVQHGVFDLAYKYGVNLVANEEFSLFKTSILFSMGNYWTQYSNISSKVYQLGYPYLEDKVNKLGRCNSNTILFISQGIVTANLRTIAIQLSKRTKYKIIYRLHPNEDISDYLEFEKYNIQITNSGDLYTLLASCKAVVGSYSTVLFEALFFDKRIFVHKNKFSDEYIPANLGIRFISGIDIINNLEIAHIDNYEKINFWSLNWKNNLEAINQLEKLW